MPNDIWVMGSYIKKPFICLLFCSCILLGCINVNQPNELLYVNQASYSVPNPLGYTGVIEFSLTRLDNGHLILHYLESLGLSDFQDSTLSGIEFLFEVLPDIHTSRNFFQDAEIRIELKTSDSGPSGSRFSLAESFKKYQNGWESIATDSVGWKKNSTTGIGEVDVVLPDTLSASSSAIAWVLIRTFRQKTLQYPSVPAIFEDLAPIAD